MWAQSDPPPVDLSVGDIRLPIAAEWLHISQRSQWRAYSKRRTALFTVRTNPRWRPLPCWKNFKWRYLRNRSSDPLHVLF